ncbi:MAG: hypothetical protein JXA68_05815 [Ignavibacteriales bacterium]|nr:hypothetical protein [Ignavibacteriales bacterium]
MAKRKVPTLRFNKNKTVDENMVIFEQYILKIDDSFGKILKKNKDESVIEIREKTKQDVSNLIHHNE